MMRAIQIQREHEEERHTFSGLSDKMELEYRIYLKNCALDRINPIPYGDWLCEEVDECEP